MDNAQIVALIMGTFAPLGIAVIQQRRWSYALRHAVALASYLALTVVVWLFQNAVHPAFGDWRELVRIMAPMLVAGNTAFALLWKQTGVADKVERVTTRQP